MSNIYAVTGGAGFIGSHIAERLLRDGDRVRVIDNLLTGRRENLDYLRALDGDLEIHEISIGDLDALTDAFKSVDCVLSPGRLAFCAAQRRRSTRNPPSLRTPAL